MSTYVPIQAITLSSNTTSIEFTGIPQTYTDLVIVCSVRDTASGTQTYPWIRFNGDSATNYSFTRVHGNGTSAASGRASNQDKLEFCEAPGAGSTANYFAPLIVQVMNYANTTTNKTTLVRTNNVGGAVQAGALACLYRSTSAVTSILINGQTALASGSTFTLYGVGTGAPKAMGGTTIRTDGTYWYHTFQSSGVFEPLETLTAEVLIVAGGGGGSDSPNLGGRGGAGGAGGLLYYGSETPKTPNGSALSLSKQPYSVVVGAGGVRSTQTASVAYVSGNGNNSSFGAYAATGGGGAGPNDNPYGDGRNGGSGGGSWYGGTPGTGISGQGNNGGDDTTSANYGGGGGGGAGAVGGNGNTSNGGNGGNGLQYSISGTATYYAGGGSADIFSPSGQTSPGTAGLGGGGTGRNNPSSYFSTTNGSTNTGGGGGSGGLGGSGVVIIRYAV